MITHRSSTTKHCDEIFKFENNRLKNLMFEDVIDVYQKIKKR